MLKLLNSNTSNYCTFLKEYCKFCQYKTIVEIGVQTGGSAFQLCLAVKETDGKFFGYDYFEPIGVYNLTDISKEKVENFFINNGIEKKFFEIKKINVHDKEFPEILKSDTNGKIDFAFIDGDHSYQGITTDFLNVYPLLSEEGTIAFHDTYSHLGCRKFVFDLYEKYNDGTYDIINLPYGLENGRAGLTLLVKRSYPIYKSGITINCHETLTQSDLMSEDVYTEEKKWYQSQLKNN